MSSKAEILQKLSIKKHAFASTRADEIYKHVVPDISDNPSDMFARFIIEAEKLSCAVHQVADEKDAVDKILDLVDSEETILGWNFEQIGLANLEAELDKQGIHLDESANPNLRYGITGVEAALAATGSIILASGAGKSRAASLLPSIHIAVMRSNQIVQDLESWVASVEKEKIFQETSNIFLISGPSKTADIAMELIMGMHGPQEMHLVIIKS